MHPNPNFRKTARDRNIEFARDRSFGNLVVNSQTGPLISHIPFQLSKDGSFLEAHIVRSNPILKLLDEPQSAVIAVNGPDAYMSPDWYGFDDQVPTWNYIAVHLRGTLKRLPDIKLRGVLERLSAGMEERLAPKTPWKIEKMSEDAYTKMERQIVPIGMEVEDIQGTWKLSQNKPKEVIVRATKGLESSHIGSDIVDLLQHMHNENEL